MEVAHEMEAVELKALEVGDIFISASGNADKTKRTRFTVRGNPFFNIGHGSATRYCHVNKTGEIVGKSCRAMVIKISESKFKDKYKSSPIKQKT